MKVSYLINLNGIVQGVGMRPFIYRLANELSITGVVRNTASGVEIIATGDTTTMDIFIKRLKDDAPPASRISELHYTKISLEDLTEFRIDTSRDESRVITSISPDLSLCHDCKNELLSPQDRRYLYPFINCTNCGPRYSIIKKIPYDRPNTTMSSFIMCSGCSREYHNPGDRRFHAQPNACPVCGPMVSLIHKDNHHRLDGKYAIDGAREILKRGGILALKGLGGFHLACDAKNDAAVGLLRERKRGNMKPFAVMVPSLEFAEKFSEVDEVERRLLLSPSSPIVLLKKKGGAGLSERIANQNDYIGIMLAYTPLHILLFFNPETGSFDLDALVMTSGNLSELPIEYQNEQVLEKLYHIADGFLLHNRDIHNRIDDSIVYQFEGDEIILRRARGYVPQPIKVGKKREKVCLATGAELKSTFALNRLDEIIISQHLGDLKSTEGIEFFIHTYRLLTETFRIAPEIAILDRHPAYLTREIVNRIGLNRSIEVQHHYAHICSVLLQENIEESVIGFAFDGTGYGDDGNIWGGEVFICSLNTYERIAHLRYVEIPGGDSASEICLLPAVGYLVGAGFDATRVLSPGYYPLVSEEGLSLALYSLKNRINTFTSSSMGRLFDAVAFLLKIRGRNSFEGEAAMALEYLADKNCNEFYDIPIIEGGTLQFDGLDIVSKVLSDTTNGIPVPVISARFHNGIARAILKLSKRIRDERGVNKVVLSGGVFQNKFLLKVSVEILRSDGFEVFFNRIVPPNDGGISFGQIGHFIYSDY